MKIERTDETTTVRFADHHVPFELTTAVCDNPDCDCRQISLYLRELTEETPMQFKLTVNVDSWTEQCVPDRAGQISRWAGELLNELSRDDKHHLYLMYDGKFAEQRLQDCVISAEDILNGALISYTNIVCEKKSIYEGGTTCISRFSHNGTEYAIDALYCPNPECPCHETHLLFVRVVPAQQNHGVSRTKECMRVRLKFDGTWHIEERWKIRFAEAKQVLIAWLKDHPRIIERVQEEYRAIKQIGVRSLEAARKPPFAQHEPTVREKKIGRNAPCICGSGKKYKKCCGK